MSSILTSWVILATSLYTSIFLEQYLQLQPISIVFFQSNLVLIEYTTTFTTSNNNDNSNNYTNYKLNDIVINKYQCNLIDFIIYFDHNNHHNISQDNNNGYYINLCNNIKDSILKNNDLLYTSDQLMNNKLTNIQYFNKILYDVFNNKNNDNHDNNMNQNNNNKNNNDGLTNNNNIKNILYNTSIKNFIIYDIKQQIITILPYKNNNSNEIYFGYHNIQELLFIGY